MPNSENIEWRKTKFFIEAKIHLPVLGVDVEVLVDPESESADVPSASQLRALDGFLSLGAASLSEWAHQVALDCHYTCLSIKLEGEEPPVRLSTRGEVWKHCWFGQVFLPKHGNSADRYIFVNGGCSWEEEHGLELLFKNELLLKVGRSEGLAQNQEWSLYFINE